MLLVFIIFVSILIRYHQFMVSIFFWGLKFGPTIKKECVVMDFCICNDEQNSLSSAIYKTHFDMNVPEVTTIVLILWFHYSRRFRAWRAPVSFVLYQVQPTST